MIKKKMNLNKYENLKIKYEKKVNILASARLIIFMIMILSFVLKYYYYKVLFTAIFIISLITFIIIIVIHDKYYRLYNYHNIYVEIINNYLKRESGEWKNFKDNGEEFLKNDNSYLKDLDILGQNSLYQLLNIAKTKGGKRKLVKRLSNNNIVNLKDEQNAIQEITNNINFCIEYQVHLSKYDNQNIDLSANFKELTKEKKIRKIDLVLGIILTSISILSLILSLIKLIDIKYFYLIFITNFLINYFYSNVYIKEYKKIDKITKTYGNMHNLFKTIMNNNFTSKKLINIKTNISNNYNIISKIEKFDIINNLRNNLISNFIFNGLSNLNIFITYYFNVILNDNFYQLKSNIDDIEELEAMLSIATLGIIKENITMPSYNDKVELKFTNIHHPLLNEKICVTNNFETKNGVNIITGSNMGGKTSFLRTIGINIILMSAGGYVCASEFNSSYFKVFTSMRVSDDIEAGISTFYGELLRIKEMIEYLEKGNMLVLIDEVFKGTNYQDRIYGAEEVIKKLNNKKTITFLTTHDFELCDVENIKNYHVKEYYEDDKICFDYKIREGKCSSTNAKYLMKKLNIID